MNLASFFILVWIAHGEPEYTMTPYLDDSTKSAMSEENCEQSAAYLNEMDKGDREYKCVRVYHTNKHMKG